MFIFSIKGSHLKMIQHAAKNFFDKFPSNPLKSFSLILKNLKNNLKNFCIVLLNRVKSALSPYRQPYLIYKTDSVKNALKVNAQHIVFILHVLIFFCLASITSSNECHASEDPFFSQVVKAIYKTENSTKYPYGIKSIDTKGNKEYARKICYNTVRNNWKRYLKTDSTPTKKEYLKFLASRYCPIGASDDPTNLNRNWLGNVTHFLTIEGAL